MRWNGSVRGRRNPPNSTAGFGGVASGVWDLRSQDTYRRVTEWPTLFTIETNLLAFYRLNDNGSGGLSLVDSSGNGRTLTATGTVNLGTGINGGAANFVRSSTPRLSWTSGSTFLNPNNAHSFAFWARPVANINYYSFISASTTGFNIHHDSGGSLYWNNGLAGDVQVNGVFSAGTWVHIVCVRNSANNMQVFRNGTSVYSSPSTRTYNNATGYSIGGNSVTAGFSMDGLLDNVGIWSRALSAAEVAILYGGGSGYEI
jgi:hypothetical protein